MTDKKTKKEKPKAALKPTTTLPKELFKLESIVGQFMEYWGFKNIHGRIWTHLFTSKSPLDSIELMSRLEVSKGLMSLAIRDLLEYDVILADHVGRHGTTFYVANPNLIGVISNVLKKRETQMLHEAREACEALKRIKSDKLESSGLSLEKIENVAELTSSAQLLLQTFLSQEPADSCSLTLVNDNP